MSFLWAQFSSDDELPTRYPQNESFVYDECKMFTDMYGLPEVAVSTDTIRTTVSPNMTEMGGNTKDDMMFTLPLNTLRASCVDMGCFDPVS